MARRGSFSRSGGAQNLSLIVYQVLKDQLNTDMSTLFQNYQTNMKAGRYSATFNGQNVDGQYVMDYMQNMMQGFPPGSSEYESLRSQLSQFQEQYKTDIQNLVIDSMNNGTQIDFGLLGSGFSNKGIGEVTLSDISAWGESEMARLRENGDMTQADKLSGAIFVAKFNVENDGKSAALTRGDISYGDYNSWLKGQLGSALSSGFTKDSDTYRQIVKQQAQAQKDAKTDGENKSFEKYQKALFAATEGTDKAAQALIEHYVNVGGALTGQLQELGDQIGSSSTPYYDLVKLIASKRNDPAYGNLYGAIMNAGGDGSSNLETLFADAVAEGNTALLEIKNGNFPGVSDAQKAQLRYDLFKNLMSGTSFVNQSGIGFVSGHAANVMNAFNTDLGNSGMSFDTSGKQKFEAGWGGHPDAIFKSFDDLNTALKDTQGSNEYAWLKDVAAGRISVDIAGSSLAAFDKDGDNYVSKEEIMAAVSDGSIPAGRLSQITTEIEAAMGSLPSPSEGVSSSTIMSAFINACYNGSKLGDGKGIAIVAADGTVTVSDTMNPTGGSEIMPTLITINGKTSIAYVEPSKITELDGNGQSVPVDAGRFNGLDISFYHLPSNIANSTNLGTTDAYVVIKDSAGASHMITADMFVKFAAANGLDITMTGYNTPGQNGPVIQIANDGTVGGDPKKIWGDMFNPTSDSSIFRLTETDPKSDNFGKLIFPDAQGKDFAFTGFVNDKGSVDLFVQGTLKNVDAIKAEAAKIAANKGKATFDSGDLVDAAMKVGGLPTNTSYATVAGLIANNEAFKTFIQTNAPEVQIVKTDAEIKADWNSQIVSTPGSSWYNPLSPDYRPELDPYNPASNGGVVAGTNKEGYILLSGGYTAKDGRLYQDDFFGNKKDIGAFNTTPSAGYVKPTTPTKPVAPSITPPGTKPSVPVGPGGSTPAPTGPGIPTSTPASTNGSSFLNASFRNHTGFNPEAGVKPVTTPKVGTSTEGSAKPVKSIVGGIKPTSIKPSKPTQLGQVTNNPTRRISF